MKKLFSAHLAHTGMRWGSCSLLTWHTSMRWRSCSLLTWHTLVWDEEVVTYSLWDEEVIPYSPGTHWYEMRKLFPTHLAHTGMRWWSCSLLTYLTHWYEMRKLFPTHLAHTGMRGGSCSLITWHTNMRWRSCSLLIWHTLVWDEEVVL